jgi:amino acid adenylation domain-containing protein
MPTNFFKAIDILHLAKQSGIRVVMNNDQLQLKYEQSTHIDKSLLEQIKGNKHLIIEYLANKNRGVQKVDKNFEKIPVADRSRVLHIPLSFSQQRLWFIDRLEGSIQYHIPAVLRLKGNLNTDALAYALRQVVQRHEVLRTSFVEDDGLVSQVVKPVDAWQLNTLDAPVGDDPGSLKAVINSLVSAPFDLERDYMLRATLIPLEKETHVLVAVIHHIASDGWSASILVKEVVELYTAFEEKRTADLLPLPIQYADFAIWQRNHLQGEMLEKKISYWKEKLSGVTPLQLPTDFKNTVLHSVKGGVYSFRVDKALSSQLKQFGAEQGATIFMTLLSAFKVLLYRYSGQEDICVGTPIAGRQQQELEGLIGFFVNSLALRTPVNGRENFIELLRKVKVTTLEAYAHQEVPFEKVVEVVVKDRTQGRSPLFQAMFVLQNTPDIPAMNLGGVQLFPESHTNSTAKFDLTLNVTETINGLQASLQYNTGLYSEASISRMAAHFTKLLYSVVNNPGQGVGVLPMLAPEEVQQVVSSFNDRQTTYPAGKSIVALFEEQAAATPNATALVFEDRLLTYRELNTKANQLARFLKSRGIQSEDLVPICIERSVGMMVGILGILKAGAAYVPLDVHYPAERLRFMIEDSGSGILLTSRESGANLQPPPGIEIYELDGDAQGEIDQQNGNNLDLDILSNQLAYIIYTSGSTGRPKGVMVEHGNVVSLVKGVDYVALTDADVILSTGSPSFDATTFEYWSMLLNGGQLVLCDETKLLDAELLKAEIIKRGVTKIWFTSSWFNQLVETDLSLFQPLQTILVGGEKLSEHHIRSVRNAYPAINIINGYGPTENTTFSLTHPIGTVEEGKAIPIGRALNNRTAYVLNKEGAVVPVGVTGEIYLGGAGIARGYLNQPELTREKFVTNPFDKRDSSKLYKTGDLGRWLPGGTIEYQGRSDEQVKIRGFRIELGEIETVVAQSGLVNQAVIIARQTPGSPNYLVGYVVPGNDYTREKLAAFLKSRLPEHMVPLIWVELDALPLTANGKVDKTSLPNPEPAGLVTTKYVAPRNELETNIAAIWQSLLKIDRVGITDNFFEVGGHSLLVIQLVSNIRKQLNLDLSISDIFIYPTIRDFTDKCLEKFKNPSLPEINIRYLVTLKATGSKPPLYIVAGGGGTSRKFMKFAGLLDPDQPVYALQPPIELRDQKEFPETIEKIASVFIEEMMITNPTGPYGLSGHCLGGIIAFEMAKQLEAMGKKVQMLAMFDTIIKKRPKKTRRTFKNLYNIPSLVKLIIVKILLKFNFEAFLFRKYTRTAIGYKMNTLRSVIRKIRREPPLQEVALAGQNMFDGSSEAYRSAAKKYKMSAYAGEIILFYAKERYYFTDANNNIRFKKVILDDNVRNTWSEYCTAHTIFDVEGDHSDMFEVSHGDRFARLVQEQMNVSR